MGLTEIDDGHGGYSHAELALAIGIALGRRPRLVPLSTGVLRIAATLATAVARVRGGAPLISHDRASYLAHPDWTVDPAVAPPRYIRGTAVPLGTGLAGTVDWYRRHGWLR